MTEELKKQGGLVDAAAADAAEEAVERAAMSTELDDAAKAAAEREARRQALYEENERAEDERARAEAERMRDVDDEDEDEDEDEDKIQISYSVGFYEGGNDLSADIETYDGGFVSYLASKGTGLETIVQELADFCDDRDETRFGENYYVLDMR